MTIVQSNNGNGHESEPEIEVSFIHLEGGMWEKDEEGELTLTDGHFVRDEIDDQDEDDHN